jgi:hypothetical protein
VGAGEAAGDEALSADRFSWRRLAILLVVVLPPVAWFLVKPVRVIAPTFAGVTCPKPTLCVDDPAKLDEAGKLYTEAEAFVSANVEQIGRAPKLVFCSTERCAQDFGLGRRAAVSLGTLGIVIGPRAWQDYLVRHEMIHYVQGRRLNVLRLLFMPKWFVEGMAYAMSEDPRAPLAEPFEGWRSEFRAWHARVAPDALWAEARKLEWQAPSFGH